ncbi:serine/threonine-protein kinase [Streptomyces sp. Tu102]|uniref:serine/threonine-protein kinase n=1 Tax=Streptomyces sp. Tu102 TaxID=2838019 RepID=UPI001BDBB1FF|nr:serine/threonine-protein kinase [Streptomyces sp. Tu102]MBT1092340.1 serine/threonine protein kinase [Streptomyces sp. Tu102]
MAGETPDHGEGRLINGRYRLVRTLGAGGMGRVWLAYDEELACEVAMKEIALPDAPMDASETSRRIARARSEARHAARLRGHPHVATVHDVVVHEGLPWIVMEHVPDAVDLQAVVRSSGPLTPAQAARVGLAVLDALTAGHRIGILHRDVKPANILLAPDASGDPHARVLLTDYGIALRPESREPRLTATAGILGTPGYLAPERARGEPPTPAADLFSLGATLYAGVEGRGPFDRHGDYATLTALLGEDPTPPLLAGELTPVLQGLLVKDPVRRSAPEAVARGLERVAEPTVGPGPAAGPHVGAGPVGFGPPPIGFGPPPGTPQTPSTPQTPGTPQTPAAPPTPNTPQSPFDPGNPYAQGTYAQGPYAQGTYAQGPYAQGAAAATTPSYLTGISGTSGAPGSVAGASGKRTAIIALVVGLVLVVAGGTWAVVSLTGEDAGAQKNSATKASPAASASRTSPAPTGPVYPYGEGVGLTEPLETGDCVRAVWSGTPFESVPNLGVVDCADDWPDGQVVAVDTAADFADARAQGTRRCERQSGTIAAALPDAAPYAVVPTRQGFAAAGSGTACLVLGRHAAIGGEVGGFRDDGENLWVGQMSVGDCWIYEEEGDGYNAPLIDCAKPHTDQVIGTVQAPGEMSHENGSDNATKLCRNKFEAIWAPGEERAVYGWIADEEDWEAGFDKAVCTVGRVDNAETTGKIPAPGAV